MSNELHFMSERKRAIISEEELRFYCETVQKYYMDLPFNEKLVKKTENYYRVMAGLFTPLNFFRRTKVLHAELLPSQEKGVIFVSNHIGSYDQFFIVAALGLRPVHYLVNQKVTTWPVRWNLIYRPSGAVVVDQQSLRSWKNTRAELVQLLLRGHDVFIFPEGTRRGEDNLGDFHPGIAQVARDSDSRIVTLAIKNTAKLFSIRSPIVCVGEMLQFGPRDNIRSITEHIQEAVYHNYEEIKTYELGRAKNTSGNH